MDGKVKKNTTYNNSIDILLAFIGINLFDFGYYFVIVALMIIYESRKKVYISRNTLVLALFASSYSFFYMFQYPETQHIFHAIKVFFYCAAHVVGMNILSRKSNDEKLVIRRILIICFSGALHGTLNFFVNFMTYGFTVGIRNFPDIWTKSTMSATLQGAIFASFIGVVYYCFFMQKIKCIKLYAMMMLICMVLYNLMSSSRTVFYLLVISLMICYISHILISKKLKAYHFALPLISILLRIIYSYNIFDIQSLLNETPLFSRLNNTTAGLILEDSRFERYEIYFNHILENPFGARDLKECYGFAHNLFLDIYGSSGIVTCIIFATYIFNTLLVTVRIAKCKKFSERFKVLVIGFNATVLIQLMTEPALDGLAFLVTAYIIVNGMIEQYYRNVK